MSRSSTECRTPSSYTCSPVMSYLGSRLLLKGGVPQKINGNMTEKRKIKQPLRLKLRELLLTTSRFGPNHPKSASVFWCMAAAATGGRGAPSLTLSSKFHRPSQQRNLDELEKVEILLPFGLHSFGFLIAYHLLGRWMFESN
jgi:hypothetical protein